MTTSLGHLITPPSILVPLEILGNVINDKSDDVYLSNLRLEKIGFVFQTFNLIATMTAYENVELPMRIHNKLVTMLVPAALAVYCLRSSRAGASGVAAFPPLRCLK